MPFGMDDEWNEAISCSINDYGSNSTNAEKKYVALIVIILLATTVHSSAFIMLPIIFVVQGKPWNKKHYYSLL